MTATGSLANIYETLKTLEKRFLFALYIRLQETLGLGKTPSVSRRDACLAVAVFPSF